MPAWPGGPCPQCGDEMPARLVHCQNCRALLNPELSEDSIEVPQFFPLREIQPMASATAKGHYVVCPGCRKELRIHAKYRGQHVKCRFCNVPFSYDTSVVQRAIYTACPHCSEEIRAATKYIGTKVACKKCNGHIELAGADKNA